MVSTLVDLTAFFHAHVPILEMTLVRTELKVPSCPTKRKAPDIDVIWAGKVMNHALTITDPSMP